MTFCLIYAMKVFLMEQLQIQFKSNKVQKLFLDNANMGKLWSLALSQMLHIQS